MSIYCITNYMADLRPCTLREVHQLVCDGYEYRWSNDLEQEVATGRVCSGCQPREARRGHLCWNCWESVETAVDGYETLSRRLAGVDRAVQRDNGGIRGQALGYIPIAAVPLMLDELDSFLAGRPQNTEIWVASEAGANNAVRFARAYKSALRNHPTEEVAHKVKLTRCPECKQKSLKWNPPERQGAEVTITCQTEGCSHIFDQSAFESIAAIEKPCCRNCAIGELCSDAHCDCHAPAGHLVSDPRGGLRNDFGDYAEPFDPTNPDHVALVEEVA